MAWFFNPDAPISGDGLDAVATVHTNLLDSQDLPNAPKKHPNWNGYPERFAPGSQRRIYEARYLTQQNQPFRRSLNSSAHIIHPMSSQSKSRHVTAYTPPFQLFNFRHTWQMPAGRQAGAITRNPSQPSVLYPQGPEQLATMMPWNQ